MPFATAHNKITAHFYDSQAPASQLVSAVFESDSKWQKIARAGIDESELIGLASSYNYLTFVAPTGFFLDSLTPRSLAANFITAQLPDKEIINERRITTSSVFLNTAVVSIDEAAAQYVIPNGIYSESFGTGDIKYLNFLVTPDGIYRDGISPSSPISSFVTARLFRKPRLPVTRITATTAYLGAPTVDESFEPSTQHIATYGYDFQLFGSSKVWLNQQHVTSIGINNLDVGRAVVINKSQGVLPQSWQSSRFGVSSIYNYRQYLYQQNRSDQSSYGAAYMQGGVKYLLPRSYDASAVGKANVTNTTANQQLLLKGIERTAIVPAPIVSPHMIYAGGIYSTLFGSIKVVPTPVLRHKGADHFEAGKTTVWYHTRPLSPTGFESYDTGYPKVFDPTQYFSPSPMLRSSVFGDVRIRNNNSYLRAPSIDSQAISEWATVEARDKQLYAKSFVAQAFGSQLIKNKSPSIFFNGLPAPIFYNQAIGYRIRTVAPTGFDRLGLGNPTVIKTPELFPRSYVATQFGTQWVSNYTRHIEHYGTNHSAAGKPTVWFRFRYARPNSWQSSRFSLGATVTHGVRELIGQGFIQQGYGTAWLSRGVRLLEPLSIVKKQQASNHFVGRHQEIKPVGFIATQFGTRIIPEIQALYPLGFTGVFGLANVDLSIRHLKPKGYSTAGDQQALRWGWHTVYNKTQYIVQEFAGDNGLVPPKWSDWTAIENRNKTIGAIGTLSQRFGYAQIDNNARLLEPQGLIATRIGDGMIAYRIRYLPLQGVEQPYMSDWLVVHNAARVIKPAGEVQSLFGDAELIKTRRYFDRIGRIESFESGTPMIAYRIRTLDIEKRYSIAPPIIRPPTIDLYTRYIEFNGYETAKYGNPSLSIHFNIIGPSWRHRDDFGESVVRNVTPELQVGAFDSQEFGQASVRTQWRNVVAQGDTLTLFGNAMIADTKREITIRGWQDSAVSQKHTVTKTGAPPYTTQNIWLQNESNPSADGFGIRPSSDPSSPGLNQNVLYPQGHNSQKFGESFIYSNNLLIEIGISTVNIPTNSPTRIENRSRELKPEGIDNPIVVGKKHRVSPSYIRPTSFNYPGEQGVSGNYKFGRTVVTNQHRTIYPKGHASSNVSYGASVELQTRYIEPSTIRGFAMGFPEIPFTPKTIVAIGFDSNEYGRAIVAPPPYTGPQTITAKGFNALLVGSNTIDLLHRQFGAIGHDSLSMGKSKEKDAPYMWQGLRIGEFIPMEIGAGDTSVFGDTTISLRIREIVLEGFIAFRSEYEPIRFKDRMTVKGTITEDILTQGINANGIDSLAIASADIKWSQQFIRPDGNSDQFRKGAF